MAEAGDVIGNDVAHVVAPRLVDAVAEGGGGRNALLSVPVSSAKKQKKQETWPRQTIRKFGLGDWPCALASAGRGRGSWITTLQQSYRPAPCSNRSTRQSRHALFPGGLLLNAVEELQKNRPLQDEIHRTG